VTEGQLEQELRMVIRQRAVHSEDKQERHTRFSTPRSGCSRAPRTGVANVAEVADEAGLAKGTVSLLPEKDELLLAVHERRVERVLPRADCAAGVARAGELPRSWRSPART